ncbi:saccharopine dehydrogenase NADP-binding domain-containing protein [Pseudomonas sp.]|uniref:saccharopine dehydrogenase NADP-binding domain-containing protein n=1 Tax=Pseudomonas sp. TaxID=306 RepID=UPI00299F0C6D|nr:saccharopine dehydrogenase NADP-binding domain-containing protein [Pseudomonas sp.]MDX1366641.1 saccharopine dehydrogenase NADP-binding domain-containing protein [Pseudomonas sp.]
MFTSSAKQRFAGRLVMLGFGCIGQGVLPLLLRHIDLRPEQLLIISADHWGLPPRGAYWYGSRLSIQQARALCPENNATSLQVTSAVMAGVIWAIQHPRRGIVEPDEMPHAAILQLCRPYLGEVDGVYSDWTPLEHHRGLFPADLDFDDPWQFKNFRGP